MRHVFWKSQSPLFFHILFSALIALTSCQLRLARNIETSPSSTASNSASQAVGLTAVSLNPTSKTLASGNSFTFTASGGTPPYTFSILSGAGSIASGTGLFTAGTAGETKIQLIDSLGEKVEATITVNPALALSPASGNLVTGESLQLSSTGGIPAYSYALSSGSCTVDPLAGLLTAPYIGGSCSIQAMDSFGNTSSGSYTIKGWTNFNSYKAMTSPSYSNKASKLAIDGTGKIYVIGSTGYASSWTIRKSSDSGTTWTIIDSDVEKAGFDIAVDSSGTVYAVGASGSFPKARDTWYVKKSTDGGTTWTVLDTYQFVTGYSSIAKAVAVHSASNTIYVAGDVKDALGNTSWLVKKSVNGGSSWSVLDHFTGGNQLQRLAIDPSGNLYAVGDNSSTGHWLVRKYTVSAASWATVDDYQYPGPLAAQAVGITIDSAGRIFVNGDRNGTPTYYEKGSVVRRSTDEGATWTTVDDFQLIAGARDYSGGIVTDASNNVYSFSAARGTSSLTTWVIRKSIDNGTTWTTANTYQYSTGAYYDGGAYGIASGTAGLFAVGFGGNVMASSTTKWLVRKSTNAGVTWTNMDDYAGTVSYAYGQSFAQDPSTGNLFTIGKIMTNGFYRWQVRKSTDAGVTWATVDDFNYAASYNNYPEGIAITSSGTLYVAGYGILTTIATHRWLVRKSTDGGTTWTTVANIAGNQPESSGAVLDNAGNIYMAGTDYVAGFVYHSYVRRSTNGGSTWTIVDDYIYPGGSGYNTGISRDASGNIYAYGYGYVGGTYHWIVRKSTNGTTWTTIDDYVGTGQTNPTSLAVDSGGNIYVAGWVTTTGSNAKWIVRKTTDGGTNWSIVDSYQPAPYGTGGTVAAKPVGIVVDLEGKITVAGSLSDSLGYSYYHNYAVVRRSHDGGATWFFNDYVQSTTQTIVPYSLGMDSTGSLFQVGYTTTVYGLEWLIRKF